MITMSLETTRRVHEGLATLLQANVSDFLHFRVDLYIYNARKTKMYAGKRVLFLTLLVTLDAKRVAKCRYGSGRSGWHLTKYGRYLS
jgi:hypothetical protein